MNTDELTQLAADIDADSIDTIVWQAGTRGGDGFCYLLERMGDDVSARQAAALVILLDELDCDVWHLIHNDRWPEGDPAEDMDDDEWWDLVATACHIEAANRGGA